MLSKVAVTSHIDDYELGAKEIYEGIMSDGFKLQKNSVGLLFLYSDMDIEDILPHIKEKFDFDIIGATCIASLDSAVGFSEMTITLMVLTADDVEFSASAMQEDITAENAKRLINETYRAAKNGLTETPRLIYAIAPYFLDVNLDVYVETLNELEKGVPVVGGLPSFNESGDKCATFFNDRVYSQRMVILIISGNIRPKFAVANVLGSSIERKREVTGVSNNILYQVGDQKFADYMSDIGLPLETFNSVLTYVTYPLLFENVRLSDGSTCSFVRTLHKVDLESGSGIATTSLPLGATMSVCEISKNDLEKGARAAIDEILAQIDNTQDYNYSALLAISCIGRYLLMLPSGDSEANSILQRLPADISMAGFYSYGELSPNKPVDGRYTNFTHNQTLVLCAI